MPVIVGALGLIRERMEQNLEKIPGASNNNELQKIVLLGMAHILSRFLSTKMKNSPSTSGPRNGPRIRRTKEAIYSTENGKMDAPAHKSLELCLWQASLQADHKATTIRDTTMV